MGGKSWERAESKLVRETFGKILNKAGKTPAEIDYIISGDLLNQCIASSFGLRESEIPFFGVFGACSTIAESLGLGAMMIDGGYADSVVAITSSHFCSAERQFRYPLEVPARAGTGHPGRNPVRDLSAHTRRWARTVEGPRDRPGLERRIGRTCPRPRCRRRRLGRHRAGSGVPEPSREYFVIAGAAADGVGIQLDDGVDHVGVCAEGTCDEGVGAQAI